MCWDERKFFGVFLGWIVKVYEGIGFYYWLDGENCGVLFYEYLKVKIFFWLVSLCRF